MPQNKFSDFKDEAGEGAREAVRIVKKQITQKPVDQTVQPEPTDPKVNKKVDPTTGKPVPSQKMLTQLNSQVAQLAQMRIKKVREELEKQRLKISNEQSAMGNRGQEAGPEVKVESKKPKDEAVQKTLAASKSTGEFKGLIGG